VARPGPRRESKRARPAVGAPAGRCHSCLVRPDRPAAPRGHRTLPATAAVLAATALVTAACSGSPEDTVAGAAATSPAASTPATGTPAPSPPAGPRTVSLVATGDVLLHEKLWEQAEKDARGGRELDFGPMLAPVEPQVSGADLALCHLETPLAKAGGPYRGYPSFSGPPEIVDALKATGYDACTTASNHTFDQGAAGVDRTLDELDAAGLAHAGSARTEKESERTTIVEAGGAKVAILSFTFGFNGRPYPGGDEWRSNLIDPDRIRAAAKQARRRGAEIVVLALHWGTEYEHEPSAQQRRLAPKLARSPDVDVIISHHAHVVEPIERIGDTWVVYGLGNLVAWHSTPVPANAEGLLVRFTFTEGDDGRFAVTKAEYDPLLVAREAPIRVLDVREALATKDYGSAGAARLRTAMERTTDVVTSRGGTRDGLVPLATP
jgi:poly-gamma-glutamate capsule biosynthesis protein CapA/YwtB (metallophosphatase superfamily)